MKATVDPEADAAYVYVTDEPVGYTLEIDEHRLVDFTPTGKVIGVEFLDVSRGVHVQGLPVPASFLAYRLQQLGIPLLDDLVEVVAINVVTSITRAAQPRVDLTGVRWTRPPQESPLIYVAGNIEQPKYTAVNARMIALQ